LDSVPETAEQALQHPAVADSAGLMLHYVQLNWTATPSVAGYNIYRSISQTGPFQKINTILDPATTFIDLGVTAGNTYHYAVTAVSGTLESPRSALVVATVPAP